MTRIRILRLTTVPMSLDVLLRGQIDHFQSLGYHIEMGSADGPEVERVKKRENAIHHVFPFSRLITPLQDLSALFKLVSFLRRNKFHIVHTHTPKAGLLGMLASWLAGVPVRLHTVAGLPLMESTGLKKWILVQVERITYRCATVVYPNSFAMKEYINKHIFESEKLQVLGAGSSNGIDCVHFTPTDELALRAKEIREDCGVEKHQRVVIFIGRVTRSKGINELVRAVGKFEDLKLFLVGPFEQELDPIDDGVMKEIQNNPMIHHFGYQSDVRPYLMAADVLGFPSYREGFPNVPMQAGAMGLPLIVTDINGCNEIVVNEKNGLLIDVKSVDSLEKAIDTMVNNTKLFEVMKTNAREMIVSRYDRELIWKALDKEYQARLAKTIRR